MAKNMALTLIGRVRNPRETLRIMREADEQRKKDALDWRYDPSLVVGVLLSPKKGKGAFVGTHPETGEVVAKLYPDPASPKKVIVDIENDFVTTGAYTTFKADLTKPKDLKKAKQIADNIAHRGMVRNREYTKDSMLGGKQKPISTWKGRGLVANAEKKRGGLLDEKWGGKLKQSDIDKVR